MNITADNKVYKIFEELKDVEKKIESSKNGEEKNYWRGEYLKLDKIFFEQMKQSEFKKEKFLTFYRKLEDLYIERNKALKE